MGENISITDMVKELTKATGRPWDSLHVTRDEFMAKKDSMDEELWLNYLAFVNGEMKRDVAKSKALVPEAEDFAAWLKGSAKAKELWGVKA